jgi:hypothetical protein
MAEQESGAKIITMPEYKHSETFRFRFQFSLSLSSTVNFQLSLKSCSYFNMLLFLSAKVKHMVMEFMGNV